MRATAHLRPDGAVERVSFLNVPNFLYECDVTPSVPGLGRVTLDIAFGGAFYAIFPARTVGLRVTPEQRRPLVAAAIKAAGRIRHPFEDDLGFL